MESHKFIITANNCQGYALVTYANKHFKSVVSEFNPPLREEQLSYILARITDNPAALRQTFELKAKGKVNVELIRDHSGSVETQQTYHTNEKIALFCTWYGWYHKDEQGQPLKYKTGAAEAGKMKALQTSSEELEKLMAVYFQSDAWYLKPKSISNFVKKYNEIRALSLAKPITLKHPLPYDPTYFYRLSASEKRDYQDFLIKKGYRFKHFGNRMDWVKV